MLPLELLPKLRAPAGKLLLIRDVMPGSKSGIIIPDSYSAQVRSSTATVLDSAAKAEIYVIDKMSDGGGYREAVLYPPGTRVLLESGAGRTFYLGMTSREEIAVTLVVPSAVRLVLHEKLEASHLGEHFLRMFSGKDSMMDPEDAKDTKKDEGSVYGKR